MYNNETKNKFIELRANGESLYHIAQKLEVSKRTLVNWNRAFQSEIRDLRAVELEALHAIVFNNRQHELEFMQKLKERVEATLLEKQMRFLTADKLFQIYFQFSKQIEELRDSFNEPLDRPLSPTGGDSDQPLDLEPTPASSKSPAPSGSQKPLAA